MEGPNSGKRFTSGHSYSAQGLFGSWSSHHPSITASPNGLSAGAPQDRDKALRERAPLAKHFLDTYPSDDEDDAKNDTRDIDEMELFGISVEQDQAGGSNFTPLHDSLFFPETTTATATRQTPAMSSVASSIVNGVNQQGESPDTSRRSPSESHHTASPLHVNSRTMIVIQKTPRPRRNKVEDDPINFIVKELRQSGHSWEAIQDYLKEEDIKAGRPPRHHSEAALYGRWVRNAERVASARNEMFNINDYKHMAFDKHKVDPDFFTKKRDRSEIDDKSDEVPKELQGNVRKKSKLLTDAEELRAPGRKAMFVDAINIVEANYWMFVADELERNTGKLYDPRVLEASAKEIDL